VPRATLLDLFAAAASESGVDLRYGVSVQSLEHGDSKEERVKVVLSDGRVLAPRLLLACDGLESRVRKAVRDWSGDDAASFEPVYLPSPSSGLRYKMLSVPSSFEIRNLSSPADSSDSVILTEPQSAYSIPSIATSSRERIRLGLLPSKDPNVPRTANIIAPANHEIWKLKTGQELLSFLGDSFPQIADISKLISPEEAQAFVTAAAGVFPQPQYVKQLATEVDDTGVILLGDAAHTFPPDLGQGVNSALEDVMVMLDALRSSGALPAVGETTRASRIWEGITGRKKLRAGLAAYQEQRAPAAEALANIVRVGFPYQYGQSFLRSKIFMFGLALRWLLSESFGKMPLLSRIFAQPCAFAVLAGEPYREIWCRAQRTTRVFQIAGLFLLAAFLKAGL